MPNLGVEFPNLALGSNAAMAAVAGEGNHHLAAASVKGERPLLASAFSGTRPSISWEMEPSTIALEGKFMVGDPAPQAAAALLVVGTAWNLSQMPSALIL